MKVVILAGGFGTRLSEYTESIPKPMLKVGGKPILWHIMNIYSHFGFKNFFLALGYKSEYIKEYFLNYHILNSDFTVNLDSGSIKSHNTDEKDWKVTLVNTGINTMTGGRIKKMKDFIGNETFMLTYGDGVSSINIKRLLKFHKDHGKMVTVSAVHPGARFGELDMEGNKVMSFKEKPQTTQGWINGGFFVMEPEFLDLIDDDTTILERAPLERVSNKGDLMAYHHNEFWHCIDTKRDLDLLEEMWKSGKAPWVF